MILAHIRAHILAHGYSSAERRRASTGAKASLALRPSASLLAIGWPTLSPSFSGSPRESSAGSAQIGKEAAPHMTLDARDKPEHDEVAGRDFLPRTAA